MPARKSSGTRSTTAAVGSAEIYRHDEKAVQRPEVGVQHSFCANKPPKTYRYDSSLDPTLSWDDCEHLHAETVAKNGTDKRVAVVFGPESGAITGNLAFNATQVFFPKTAAWDNLKRALGASLDESVWDHLSGTVSEPFLAGTHKRIAVKVIDARGNELMVVKTIDPQGA